MIEPTYGEIEVMGVDMRERPEDVYRTMGFMPDFPPVYEDLLVWEFLDLFAASYGIPRARRPVEVDRFLEMVGLSEKRKSLVVELSRGMRQRLMLAKTLIPDPRVLLLDEPASGVDPQGRIELKNILRRLAEEKRTVLISSHILTEMDEFCTSVAIMERGKLKVGGRIDEVNQRIMGDTLDLGRGAGRCRAVRVDRACLGQGGAGRAKEPGTSSFGFRAIRRRPASCSTALVHGGVRVASFERRRDNLEELFLKVGSKELS